MRFDCLAYDLEEFAGRQFAWIYRVQEDRAVGNLCIQIHPQAAGTRAQCSRVFLKEKHRRALPTRSRRHDHLRRQRGFSRAGSPKEQGACAALKATAEQSVERRDAAVHGGKGAIVPRGRRDDTRENSDSAGFNLVIMKSTMERTATHLRHAEATTIAAELGTQLVQRDDAMNDRVRV